jgi:hypothetical protein
MVLRYALRASLPRAHALHIYLRIHIGQSTCLISFILFLIAPELLRICAFNRLGLGWNNEKNAESELRIGFTKDGLLVNIYCSSLAKQQELQKKLAHQMGTAVVFLGQPRVEAQYRAEKRQRSQDVGALNL